MSLTNKTGVKNAVDDMQQSFVDYWEARPLHTKLYFGNLDQSTILSPDSEFKVVNNVDRVDYGEALASLTIQHTQGAQVALGVPRYDQRGSVLIKLYTEFGKSRYNIDSTLVDSALNYFQRGTVDGVFYWESTPNEVGQLGRWWVTDIIASFMYTINRGS